MATSDLLVLIGLRLLLGVAEAFFFVAGYAALADLAPPGRTGWPRYSPKPALAYAYTPESSVGLRTASVWKTKASINIPVPATAQAILAALRRLKPFDVKLHYHDVHRLPRDVDEELGLTWHPDARSLASSVDVQLEALPATSTARVSKVWSAVPVTLSCDVPPGAELVTLSATTLAVVGTIALLRRLRWDAVLILAPLAAIGCRCPESCERWTSGRARRRRP